MTWTDTLCLGMCAVYSFFGITLAISMRSFWGPDSPGFTYWNVGDASGEWFARALGIWMTAVTTSPYWAGMDKNVLAKIYIIINVLFVSIRLFLRNDTLLSFLPFEDEYCKLWKLRYTHTQHGSEFISYLP